MSAELPPVIATDGSLLDPKALGRQKLWEELGMFESPKFMTEEIMNRDYRGRFTCINKDVLREAQQALKFIACPGCVIEKSYGEITVTRFHIRVQDDVMTVFKAMARCFCYNCAHEEYWPLSRDPRTRAQDEERYAYEKEMMHRQLMQQQARNAAMQHSPPLGLGVAGAGLLGSVGGLGANPVSNPLNAMRPDEMAALQRLYTGMPMDEHRKQTILENIRKKMGL